MSVRFHINLRRTFKFNNPLSDNGIFLKADNGKTVILVHGLTGTPNEMKFLANFLYKKGYSVICPRLARHGEPLAILKNAKWQDFYQSVRMSFKQVKDNKDLIFVAGLSMGALLALLLAEEFQNRITGVSCLSPTLFYDGWNAPWYRCFLSLIFVTGLRYFLYFKEDPPYGIKNEDIRKLIHKYYSFANIDDIEGVARHGYPFFPVTLLYQQHLLIKYLISRLKNINLPVQLIQARDDDITSVRNSQFIYDRVKSKDKEIVLLYNSYHLITADQERDKVAWEMEKFFGRYQTS